MNTVTEIKTALDRILGITENDTGVRVNTHCLYPNNSFVRVAVQNVGVAFVVSDEGGAFREVEQSGATIDFSDKKFTKTLHAQGLHMKGGVIFSSPVSREWLPLAIAMVGNASKETADWIFEHWNMTRGAKFKDVLKDALKIEFQEVKEQQINGVSNKSHTFDNVVQFLNGSRLLVDAVVRDSNSINARVVANLDVKNAGYEKLHQAIVYDDDREDWAASELSLLQVSGVPIIPFTKSGIVLKRFASGGYRLGV